MFIENIKELNRVHTVRCKCRLFRSTLGACPIRNADRILVLTEDGIEESGTHQELMEKGGIYSELYALYSTL